MDRRLSSPLQCDCIVKIRTGEDDVEVRYASNGDVRIAYETFGCPGGTPLLMIQGLDAQMVWWPDGLCDALVERGFHVVRFDNRDAGLSTHFTSAARENPFKVLFRGSASRPAYTLDDMLNDGIAVMDALGWDSAHLFGASMGSGLVLATAIRHPRRVRTVTAALAVPPRRRDMFRYLKFGTFLRFARIRHPDTEEGAIETWVDIARVLASPNHPFDGEWARSTARISHARAPQDPADRQRQLAAGRAAADLSHRLGEITAPTLIINGADDPIVRRSAAAALARLIPGARATLHPAMGHELPRHLWPAIADAIEQHALRSGGAGGPSGGAARPNPGVPEAPGR
jgi:pimeloyl-ACP methyl ester carboxylesterase